MAEAEVMGVVAEVVDVVTAAEVDGVVADVVGVVSVVEDEVLVGVVEVLVEVGVVEVLVEVGVVEVLVEEVLLLVALVSLPGVEGVSSAVEAPARVSPVAVLAVPARVSALF